MIKLSVITLSGFHCTLKCLSIGLQYILVNNPIMSVFKMKKPKTADRVMFNAVNVLLIGFCIMYYNKCVLR